MLTWKGGGFKGEGTRVRLVRRIAISIVVTLLASPLALAHPGDEYPVVQATGEGISGYLTIQTMALMVGKEANFTLGLFDARTYAPDPSRARSFMERDGAAPIEVPLAMSASGDRVGSIAVDARGMWRLRVVVNETVTLTFAFEAYPLATHRAASNDARYRLYYADTEAALGVTFVDIDTGLPDAGVRSGEAVIERWSAGFAENLDEDEQALASGELPGQLVLRHRLGAPGAYQLRFGSRELGIRPADLPPFRIQVNAGQDPDAPARDTDAAPLALVLGVVALAGLARRAALQRK